MSASTVSIVVPCFDTERYLDECLGSLTGQTYHDLEIVAVDDGSEDGTRAKLEGWAATDGRITVVAQDNRGLGAARNTGLRHSTGDYLTFVDSDDLLPLDAIERMVATIERTGSDFVSGVANRFDEDGQWRASLYRRGFKEDLDRTHVYDRPSLLNDHIVCSKLFRRSFWDRHQFKFPEGTLFEDIEVATRAHCLATSVDLIAQPTYLWRSRPIDDISITQDRRRPGSVTARFAALGAADRFIRDNAPENVWRRHGMKLVTIDVPLYARELSADDTVFQSEFFQAARPVLVELAPQALQSLGPMHILLRDAVLEESVEQTLALAKLLKPESRRERVAAFRMLSPSARRTIVVGAVRRRLPG